LHLPLLEIPSKVPPHSLGFKARGGAFLTLQQLKVFLYCSNSSLVDGSKDIFPFPAPRPIYPEAGDFFLFAEHASFSSSLLLVCAPAANFVAIRMT